MTLQTSGSPAQVIRELKQGNERFRQARSIHPHATEARLHELESGQAPQAAVLSCSDSRVAVELLFDSGFGDLFVIRNAGNSSTPGTLASVEYAVKELQVPVVVVMSHSGCGAVGAACAPQHLLTPTLLDHVGHIREGLQRGGLAFAPAVDLERAYDLHARITARELINTSTLLRERLRSGRLEIHAACFELVSLEVRWLGAQDGA
ncbi:MAG: carbonic anhydrase [Cyanobacteriota bacterium]